MKRSEFLRKFGIGLAVAPVALPAAASLLAKTAEAGLTENKVHQGLLAMIEDAGTTQTYTVLTGSEGMKAFDQAMKDYMQEAEDKIWYGRKS